MKNLVLFTSVLLLLAVAGRSQSLKPIFDKTPRQLVSSKVLISYPKNTFLENLVEGNDGNLYVTNYPEGLVIKVSKTGTNEIYATVPGKIAGLAAYSRNSFLVTGWDDKGKPGIFLINEKKEVTKRTDIAGAYFPNAIIHFKENNYLIADSYAGCIWIYNATDNSVSVWLKDELLARSSTEAQTPAANGLRIYKNSLYVSNTEKQILIKIPLANISAGKPELFLSEVGVDDFSFDEDGNIYAATHVYNDVIKITPAKEIFIIAGIPEGVAGCTAVIFSKDTKGKPALFVTTNGGMSLPTFNWRRRGKGDCVGSLMVI